MLSNSTADLVYELYDKKGIAKFHTVETKRVISAKASSRGTINELVITNY
jgi:site-specific DNA-adenine methylase